MSFGTSKGGEMQSNPSDSGNVYFFPFFAVFPLQSSIYTLFRRLGLGNSGLYAAPKKKPLPQPTNKPLALPLSA
jgi:hypothetical protein